MNSNIIFNIDENNSKLGINKNPTYTLDINGDFGADKIYTSKLFNKNNELSLNNQSYIFSNNFGINNNNPEYDLDVNGDIKFSKSLYDKNNNKILSTDEKNIILNPNNEFNEIKLKGNIHLKNNDIKLQSLELNNNIYDNNKNQIISLDDDKINRINNNFNKRTEIFGKVNFLNNNVHIGDNYKENNDIGNLYVDNNIYAKSIKLDNKPNTNIEFPDFSDSNIKLGKYSYISNSLNNDTVLGNNIYIQDNKIKIPQGSNDDNNNYGYRGIILNHKNGIQFYTSSGNRYYVDDELFDQVNNNDTLNAKPHFTISNSGQIINTIPILPDKYFYLESNNVPNRAIRKYISNELFDKKIGSTFIFSTESLINTDKIIEIILIKDKYIFYIHDKINNSTIRKDFSLD